MGLLIQGQSELLGALNNLKDSDYSGLAIEIKTMYQDQVYAVDAIDTGRFIQSIDWKHSSGLSSEGNDFIVDTSKDPLVTYDDIVERGRKPPVNYPGRWPAKRALEKVNFIDAFDAVVYDAFHPILV